MVRVAAIAAENAAAAKVDPAGEPACFAALLAPNGLSVFFQPIYEIRGGETTMAAAECLSRPPRYSGLHSVEALFRLVREWKREAAFDRTIVGNCLRAARRAGLDLPLFLNVHLATISRDPAFAAYLLESTTRHGVPARRLTVELVGPYESWNSATLEGFLRRVRERGVSIAIDDVGADSRASHLILETAPDVVKIDRHFVHGLHEDPHRRAIVRAVVRLAERVNAKVVAEGVERTAELEAVAALGIGYVQGYLLGPPQPGDVLRLARSSGPSCLLSRRCGSG